MGTLASKKAITILLLTAAISGIYAFSVKAPFILDDKSKIINNPDIRKLDNLTTRLVYPYAKTDKSFRRNDPARPVTFLSYTLNYHFGKLDPSGYRAVNILIHILNSVLVFLLALRIFRIWPGGGLVYAAVAAALFAVHPVNTSTVSYVYARSGELAAFFYLAAILLFLRSNGQPVLYGTLCTAGLVLALFSKQTAVTLPLMLLIADYLFLSSYDIRNILRRKYIHACMWAVLAGYMIFTRYYIGGIRDVVAEKTWPGILYLVIQPYAVLRYLMLVLLPARMCIDHTLGFPASLFEPRIIIPSVMMLFAAWGIYRLFRKKSPGPALAAFGAIWFFITLSPTSSFVPTTSALAEYRLYLPAVGIFIAMAAGVRYLAVIFEERKLRKRLLYLLVFSYIALLSAKAASRNILYNDPALLWKEVISLYPGNLAAYTNLGNLYKNRGLLAEAEREYLNALELHPGYALAHLNLAGVYLAQNRPEMALEEYRRTLELDPGNSMAYNNMGILFLRKKDHERAMGCFREASSRDPMFHEPYLYTGIIHHEKGELQEAADAYRIALQLDPDLTIARTNLGTVWMQMGDIQKAKEEFREAVRKDPGSIKALYSLGRIHYMEETFGDGAYCLERAVELEPENPETHFWLGMTYFKLGMTSKSLNEFKETLRINPGHEPSIKNMSIIIETMREQAGTAD